MFYRNNERLSDIALDERSTHKKNVTGEDIVDIVLVSSIMYDFQINDYIIWDGYRYTLYQSPTVTKRANNHFEYQLQFESAKYALRRVSFLFNGNSDFFMLNDAEGFVALLLENLLRVDDTWTSNVIVATRLANIQFQNEDCLTAINRICDELEVELDIIGKQINVRNKIGITKNVVLSYKSGLTELKRIPGDKEQDIVTKLYAYGSDRNVPLNYGGRRLKISPIEMNVDKYGVCEGVKVFDEVYPHFNGIVGALDGLFSFTDITITFDVNAQLIGGITAKIAVLSGDLAGYDFEITNYDNATKKVTLKKYVDENGNEYPNQYASLSPGDKYTFIDIIMPQVYVENAEIELLGKAESYLQENSEVKYAFQTKVDERWLKANGVVLNTGDEVTISDNDLGVSQVVRIVGMNKVLVDEYKCEVYLADKAVVDKIVKLRQGQYNINASLERLANELKILKQ